VGSVGPDESTSRPALLQTLRASFTGAQDIVAAMSSDRFVALHRLPPAHRDDGRGFEGRALGGDTFGGHAFGGQVDELQRLCRKTIDEIGRRHGLIATVGIGDRATTVVELHESYRDASVALRLGARLATRTTNEPRISSIDDLRIHQLLAAVGHRPRARLIEALTADLRAQPDWPALRQTLMAWCESGFNLVHAASALHIHRNTLVYRLNKIAQRTGRPARDHRATLALYLACLADQIHDPGQP
jgi:carbohydrate diacid regulator